MMIYGFLILVMRNEFLLLLFPSGLFLNYLFLMLLKRKFTAWFEIGILSPFWMTSLFCWRAATWRRAVRHWYSVACLFLYIFRNFMLTMIFVNWDASLFITLLLLFFFVGPFFSLRNVIFFLVLWKNTRTILIPPSFVSINLSLSWWPTIRHRCVTLTWLCILNFRSIFLSSVSIKNIVFLMRTLVLIVVFIRKLNSILFFIGLIVLILKSFLNFSESLVQSIFTMPSYVLVNLSSYWIGRFQPLLLLLPFFSILFLIRLTPPVRVNYSVDCWWARSIKFFNSNVGIVNLVPCISWL